VIPDSVTSIGEYAFYECINLTDITFGNSLTTIGLSAFRHCSGLRSLTIPDSVTSIGGWAFQGCKNLSEFKAQDNLKIIGEAAFRDCSGLKKVAVGSGITTIFGWAFADCKNLEYFSLPIKSNLNYLGYAAFLNCGKLKEITIPNNLKEILDQTFFGCKSLKKVKIGENLSIIADRNFEVCLNLETFEVDNNNLFFSSVDGVMFDKKLTKIIYYPKAKEGNYILPYGISNIRTFFRNCKLSSIVIPDSVTTIPRNAFEGSSLTNITIGKGVTRILDYAFSKCSKLEVIHFEGNAPNIVKQTVFKDSSVKRIIIKSDSEKYNEIFKGLSVELLSEKSEIEIDGIFNVPFGFSFAAQKGKLYVVEVTQDFKQWGELETIDGSGKQVKFIDPRQPKMPFKRNFYRVKVVE